MGISSIEMYCIHDLYSMQNRNWIRASN